MIGYRKVDGKWVETTLKIKELRLRASRHRNERILQQAKRAETRLQALQASCTHEVISRTDGPTYSVTTCAICGKAILT
jgi:hypothetical protein